ncbi:MAG: putative glycosyltransferase [Deinococcota bacterium]|jgi:glycosyltransferase involved in cell wall biosynthesis
MIYWVNQYAITPDSPGGTRHYEFGKYLKGLDEDVVIVASDLNLYTRQYRLRSQNNQKPILETVQDVKFHWLFATAYQKNNWSRVLSMLSFSWSVFFHLLRVKTDTKTVFIGSSPHLFAALVTQMAAWVRGVPFILEIRDLWPETLIDMTGKKGFQALILRLIANYLYKMAKKIIVLSLSSKEHIAKLGFDSNKIVYIPNGVDIKDFNFQEKPSSPIELPINKKIFVYTGAHGPANELGVVLEAAYELQNQNQNHIHILLVGDGPSKQELVLQAKELKLQNLTFHDPIKKQDIPRLLANVDVGLLILKDAPVFRYGISPNKLFDYMAIGLPVVSNVQGDMAEIIKTANNGITVESGNSKALAVGMLDILREIDRNSNMGQEGTSYILEHHNREKLAQQVKSLLKVKND